MAGRLKDSVGGMNSPPAGKVTVTTERTMQVVTSSVVLTIYWTWNLSVIDEQMDRGRVRETLSGVMRLCMFI